MILCILAMVLVSFVSFAQAGLLRRTLDTLFGSSDALPSFLGPSFLGPSFLGSSLWGLAVGMVGLSLVRAASTGFLTVTLARLSDDGVALLQQRVFDRLVATDLDYIHGRLSGGLVGRLVHDVGQVRQLLGGTLAAAGRDVVTALALLLFMLWTDWRLTLSGTLVFAAAALPLGWLSGRMAAHSHAVHDGVARLAGHMGQVFQGVRHVKAYRAEAAEVERTATLIREIRGGQERQARIRSLSAPLMEMAGAVALAVFLLVGGGRVADGRLTPGALVTVSGCLLALSFLLRNLANVRVAAQQGRVALVNLYDLIHLPVGIVDAADAIPLRVERGGVRFRAVGFTHADGRTAVRDLDLDIPGGGTVALVGPSGAGKSTVLNLLLRFHDPQRGSVAIDGVDIRRVTLASLRESVALVSQEGSVFDDTVRANIAYGRPDAGEAEIRAAARAADAEDFILGLPDGYDTRIGERGIRLSGGQAQRLALARAILRRAPILLLDEATAALDTGTERAVLDNARRHGGARTCIIVTHRLAAVMDADLICVMEGGRIVEAGQHHELLGRRGAYARLWAEPCAPWR